MLITLQCVKKFHCGSIRAARRSGSYSLPNAFKNAATSGNNTLLVDQTEENFDQVFAVNVKGLFVLLQQELKRMLFPEQGGAIVNAASVGGASRNACCRPLRREQTRRAWPHKTRPAAARSRDPV